MACLFCLSTFRLVFNHYHWMRGCLNLKSVFLATLFWQDVTQPSMKSIWKACHPDLSGVHLLQSNTLYSFFLIYYIKFYFVEQHILHFNPISCLHLLTLNQHQDKQNTKVAQNKARQIFKPHSSRRCFEKK